MVKCGLGDTGTATKVVLSTLAGLVSQLILTILDEAPKGSSQKKKKFMLMDVKFSLTYLNTVFHHVAFIFIDLCQSVIKSGCCDKVWM